MTINKLIQPKEIGLFDGAFIYDLRDRYPYHLDREYAVREPSTVDTLIVHQSVTAQGTSLAGTIALLDAVYNFHIGPERGWPGTGYQFLASPFGIFYVNGIGLETYHTAEYNKRGVAICLLGNFKQEDMPYWAKASVRAVKKFCEPTTGPLAIAGHMDYTNKVCPSEVWKTRWKSQLLSFLALPSQPPVPTPVPPAPVPPVSPVLDSLNGIWHYSLLVEGQLNTVGVPAGPSSNIKLLQSEVLQLKAALKL